MIALFMTSALAFNTTGNGWNWEDEPLSLPVVVDLASFPAGFAAEGELEDVIRLTTEIYNLESDAALHLEDGGVAANVEDEVRLVYRPSTPGGAVGVNTSFLDARGNISCEIEVYGANGIGPIDWYTGVDAADIGPGQTDLLSVVLHEMGHCLGLDHTPVPEAVMAPAQLVGGVLRTFHPDDIAGFQFLYGILEIELEAAGFTLDDDDGDGVLERDEVATVTFDLMNLGNSRTLETSIGADGGPEGVRSDTVVLETVRHVGSAETIELSIVADDTCRAKEETVEVVVTTARGVSIVAGTVPVECTGALGCSTLDAGWPALGRVLGRRR